MIHRTHMRWLTLCLLALCLLLGGCKKADTVQQTQDNTKSVSVTFYPLYCIAVNLVQDVPDLSLNCLIQPQDGCLRSYSLSEWDYLILTQQDAVIFGGRGLESFESQIQSLEDGPILISALEGLTLKNNGEQASEESTHLDGENPFVFFSTGGAMNVASSITYSLAEIDPEYAEVYQKNLNEYLARLEKLAAQMSQIMAGLPNRRVALLNEGLIYFAEQFALNVVANISHEPGTSEVDADLEVILTALEEADTQVVLLESQADLHLIEDLKAAGYSVALVDILSSHAASGDLYAYENIMLENCERVAQALRQ